MNFNSTDVILQLNELLKTNYSLPSFKTLNSRELLQIISDVLIKFTNMKLDTVNNYSEQSVNQIYSILEFLKYPETDETSTLKERLITGDHDSVYIILQWLFSNYETINKRTYLSRFLVKVELPTDFSHDVEIYNIYQQYLELIEEFKILHKEREEVNRSSDAVLELKNDLNTMERECQTLVEKINKVKKKTEARSSSLELAHLLRLEKRRNNDLLSEYSEEKKIMDILQISFEKVKTKHQSKQSNTRTPQTTKQLLTEEIMISSAIYNEKLLVEYNSLKTELDALHKVHRSTHISPDEIIKLQQNLDTLVNEVHELVETKLSNVYSNKMIPFKQQATAISRTKWTTLDKLEKTESDLEILTEKLQRQKIKITSIPGELLPKREDLKQYVSHLKTKSCIYKRNRAELSMLKLEHGIITRTENILTSIIGNTDVYNITTDSSGTVDVTLNNSAANDELLRNLLAAQLEITNFLNDLRHQRNKMHDIDKRHENAAKNYNAFILNSQNATSSKISGVDLLKKHIEVINKDLKKLENKKLRFQEIQQHIMGKIQNSGSHDFVQLLANELDTMITFEKQKLDDLRSQEVKINSMSEEVNYHVEHWNKIIVIFELKTEWLKEKQKSNHVMLYRNGTEALILQ